MRVVVRAVRGVSGAELVRVKRVIARRSWEDEDSVRWLGLKREERGVLKSIGSDFEFFAIYAMDKEFSFSTIKFTI